MKQKTRWLMVPEIVAALYVLLFVYTGVDKLRNWELFRGALQKSELTADYAGLLGTGIPLLELGIALAVIIPFTRWVGILVGTALMTAFTIYVAYMIAFSPLLPCTCGGLIQEMTWHQHLYFNATFVALGLLSLIIILNHQLFIAIKQDERRTPA